MTAGCSALAFEGVEVVFHLAALLNTLSPGGAFQRTNVHGTTNLCERCVAAARDHDQEN